MTQSDSRPRFLEFFAGGGLARLGLAGIYDCAFANDFDALKAQTYQANFPDDPFNQGDVWKLTPDDLPTTDLAWASFPCQDLSLAGARKGLNAPRSGAFWGFWRLIEGLDKDERAPRTLALENVTGLISSRRGKDLEALTETLANAGYRVGAMVLDAADHTPQSRPRLFIIAHKGRIPDALQGGPDVAIHPPGLRAAVGRMSQQTRMAWVWWKLPTPPTRNTVLADLLDRTPDASVWKSDDATARMIDMMAPLHRARLDTALNAGDWQAGAIYRRIRVEAGAKVQRAEIRYDGMAGCLRTPAGGSSRQFLMITEGGKARLRHMTAREAARLMGVDEDYRLPARETPALKVLGDAVCVPVVRWLGTHLLAPLTTGRLAADASRAA